MTASLSQHNETHTTGAVTSSTVTVTAVSAGDTAVVWAMLDRNPGTVTVSGLGATWTRLQHVDNTAFAGAYYQLWVGTGCTAGGTTITVTSTLSAFRIFDTQVWAGAPSAVTSAISAATTSTSPITPTVAATAVGQGVAGFFGQFQGSHVAYSSYTDTGDTFTVQDDTFNAAMATQTHSASTVSTAAQTERHQANGGPNQEWVSAAVILGAASSASSTSASWARSGRTMSTTAATQANDATSGSWARSSRTVTATTGSTVGTGTGTPAAVSIAPWNRRTRSWFSGSQAAPPVAAPPAGVDVVLHRRASYYVDPPIFAADGWSSPTQPFSVIYDGEWRRFRLRFAGIDLTFFRGVPVQLLRYSFSSPFGPDTAVVRFPQTTPFERPGYGDLTWLIEGKGLRIDLIDAAGTVDPTWTWVGQCQSITPVWTDGEFAFEAEFKGFGYQAADYRQKPLPTARDAAPVDVGTRLAETLNVMGRHYPAVDAVVTGVTTRKRGSLSQTAIEFARELLADTIQPDGSRYTIVASPGTRVQALQIAQLNPMTADYTISLGQPGCDFSGLAEDNDELPNVVYGEWVDPNGGRHQRLKWPRYLGNTAPAFPLSAGSAFHPGGGTTGLQDFSDWMRANGYSQFDSQDTYLTSDEDDIRALQKQMGVLVNGLIDANTWGTAFNAGGAAGDLRAAVYLPLAEDPRVEPWLYGPDGAQLGPNPAYDPYIRRKETYLNFGEGLTYRQVRTAAQQIVNRTLSGAPSLVGQIVCTTDPEETSWVNVVAGTTLRARYLYGSGGTGILFHVANLLIEPQDNGEIRATLDVDTMWRDAVTVADIIARNKAARDDPARQLRARRSSATTQDTKIQFDADDVGRVYKTAMVGGRWRVVEIPAATWGTFVRVVANTDPDCEFAVGLFEKEITERDLDRLVGDPLATANTRPWTPSAPDLAAAGLIQAWGSAAQPCGYSKMGAADGFKDNGPGVAADPLTGRLEYDSNVDFAPYNGASLFVAVWVAADTKFGARFYLQPVEL